MTAPSGYGSVASRAALIATSLPRMARISLRLPSSWATEINLQSRYSGGILPPKIGEPSSLDWLGAMVAAQPATPAAAASRLILELNITPDMARAAADGSLSRWTRALQVMSVGAATFTALASPH